MSWVALSFMSIIPAGMIQVHHPQSYVNEWQTSSPTARDVRHRRHDKSIIPMMVANCKE
ncbi:hypothetical protein PILCRDRAFT_828526 [Piloderma croceum F 1598]|uniref:Uncharacterized protein n=1 Tax=Piloderma croceum (strain F 1598) TaxID=765440 RepID=A0A0C3ENH9_PILCF|nr:hypothetical protein PILCRDRAFT_828526 [Piloderma croceum F 1598]